MPDSLTNGRAAFAREAWSEAFALLTDADDRTALEADDLDRLATSAHLIGRDAEGLDARARAYADHLSRGDTVRAARSAFWFAFAILDKPEQQAQAGGWLARARRLVEQRGTACAEEGFLLCALAFRRAEEGDVAAAHEAFRQASTIGAEFHDPDITALARHGEGRLLIRMNRKAEGLALLDEVMVGVTQGEVAPLVAGLVYCSVIGACHELFDWRRAQEWTDALAGWCESHPDMVPFRGTCLVRRSEVMQLRGAWQDAIAEAKRACTWLDDPPGQPDVGAAHYQLADLHRLRGEFDLAEQAYRRASQAGSRTAPGLALLHLSQGRTDAACQEVRRALQETGNRRARAVLLRGCVDILVASGDVAAAREAAGELARIAGEINGPFLEAASGAASGAVALAERDAAGALASLRESLRGWLQLGAPYEVARVRMLMGMACRQLDDPGGAQLEFEAAQEIFERLGAAPDAERAAGMVAAAEPAASNRTGLTGREVEVLRLVATGRTNRVIAAELGISEKTVARHISNIFTKLDLSSRSAATAYAYEHRLL